MIQTHSALPALLVAVLSCCARAPADLPDPSWVGRGRYRLLVEVQPVDLGSRHTDELPARIAIAPDTLRQHLGVQGRIDVASFEVERYDPATGLPLRRGKWAYAHADWEVPYRWFDASVPEDYPEVTGNLNAENGELTYTNERNWGYLHETLGEWNAGTLAWMHTQHDNGSSYYAVYFDLLPDGRWPEAVPRRGYLGNGTERVTEVGASSHGLLLSRIDVADWNGDTLLDIIVGGERGTIIWYPNRGTPTTPEYPYSRILFRDDGKPLDVGFSATPLVTDWDGDGLRDLVSGAEWNRVVWFKNVGNVTHPSLEYMGLVRTVDGRPMALPWEPVPEAPNIYEKDYHPVLALADLYGTGRPGLVAGGYVTGRIYYFDNLGRAESGLPTLEFEGPLEANARPLDVIWSAAPAVADFNGDGLLDIISGSMYMDPKGGEHPRPGRFLLYFRNVGTQRVPRFSHEPFPLEGTFPEAYVAAPRAADLNGDGLLDLVVGAYTNLALYLNVGTRSQPRWRIAPPLPGRWNSNPLGWAMQPLDWNGDGLFDLVDNFDLYLNTGKGNPQLFDAPRPLLAPAQRIFHQSPRGDQWTFTHLADLDGDGATDILYGVHEGHVYYHRNLARDAAPRFDQAGVALTLRDGTLITVGPQPGQAWDFDVLQGARTTVAAADFDRDGKLDLVVGDTFGKVRYYRNASGGAQPVFETPAVIADAQARLVPGVADWNDDGWPDVLVGATTNFIVLNSGQDAEPPFLPQQKLDLPSLPFTSSLMAVDWNRDGDVDIMARASYHYLFWFERSFLRHGYPLVALLRGEGKPSSEH